MPDRGWKYTCLVPLTLQVGLDLGFGNSAARCSVWGCRTWVVGFAILGPRVWGSGV